MIVEEEIKDNIDKHLTLEVIIEIIIMDGGINRQDLVIHGIKIARETQHRLGSILFQDNTL